MLSLRQPSWNTLDTVVILCGAMGPGFPRARRPLRVRCAGRWVLGSQEPAALCGFGSGIQREKEGGKTRRAQPETR